MNAQVNDIRSPDALLIAADFIRLNGPDGRAVARANARTDGTWDVRGLDGTWTNTTVDIAHKLMEAHAIAYALGA